MAWTESSSAALHTGANLSTRQAAGSCYRFLFMYATSYNPFDIAICNTNFHIIDENEYSNFALTGHALAFLQKPQEHEIQKYIFDGKTPTADAAISALNNL